MHYSVKDYITYLYGGAISEKDIILLSAVKCISNDCTYPKLKHINRILHGLNCSKIDVQDVATAFLSKLSGNSSTQTVDAKASTTIEADAVRVLRVLNTTLHLCQHCTPQILNTFHCFVSCIDSIDNSNSIVNKYKLFLKSKLFFHNSHSHYNSIFTTRYSSLVDGIKFTVIDASVVNLPSSSFMDGLSRSITLLQHLISLADDILTYMRSNNNSDSRSNMGDVDAYTCSLYPIVYVESISILLTINLLVSYAKRNAEVYNATMISGIIEQTNELFSRLLLVYARCEVIPLPFIACKVLPVLPSNLQF